MTRRNRSGSLVAAVLIVIAAGVMGVGAQRPSNPGRSGFRVLVGAEAASFALPSDVRLVARNDGRGAAAQITTERYQQFVAGAEVLGGQLTIYSDRSGRRTSVIGAHFPNLVPANAVRLSPDQAQVAAAARRPLSNGTWRTALLIAPETSRFFYQVEFRGDDARWFYWVDAESSTLLNEYDGLTTGNGVGVHGDQKDLTGLTSYSSGAYRMVSGDGRQSTYDARNRTSLPGVVATDSDDVWDTIGTASPGQHALVDAQFYAHVTDDFYRTTSGFGFNWTLHYPQGIKSSAHVGRRYNNAYWNGSQMAYGDGDGVSFIEFSGDLDVVGHELTHGVTEATSNLIYQNESGALNEAFSDIMGTSIEWASGSGNWTIGEDVTLGTNGIRNMANPNEDGDPSHYADRYTGTSDNGGVHTNSGIANHWFYLLVNGGSNATSSRASGTPVVGIGQPAAQQIAYFGFAALTASADFCAARSSTIAVADGLAANVADAWDEVGVDSALCGAGGGSGATAPEITSVASKKLKGTKFQITWTTDVAADSTVTFTCCGSYTNSSLVTSHKMQFTGTAGAAYTYYVSSAVGGVSTTAGPYTHQN